MGGGILKGKNGITMIQTVITIVMMILIAGFSIYNSKDTLVETKLTKAYNEILEVKRAVQGVETLELFKMSDIGTPVEDFKKNTGDGADRFRDHCRLISLSGFAPLRRF